MMGFYILLYPAICHALPWPEKPKSDQTRTAKNKNTKYSKLLSVTFENIDTSGATPERRNYDGSGFREPKFCASCNAKPWVPVIKFSQRAPKNIIYQEETYQSKNTVHDNNHANTHNYEAISTHLKPPQSKHNFHHQEGSLVSSTYDMDPTPLTPCDLLKHNSLESSLKHSYKTFDSGIKHNHNSLASNFKQNYNSFGLDLKENHDSIISGSEQVNSVENDKGLIHHLDSYKEPFLQSEKFFRYLSYQKHPVTPPRQNLISDFTNFPPHSNHYHDIVLSNANIGQMNEPSQHRDKDLSMHIHDYKQSGQYEGYNHRGVQYNNNIAPYQYAPTLQSNLNSSNSLTNPVVLQTYNLPAVPTKNGTVHENNIQFDINHNAHHIQNPVIENSDAQYKLQNMKQFASTNTDINLNMPPQYLTPPKFVSGNRNSKEYQHYMQPAVAEDNELSNHSQEKPHFSNQDTYVDVTPDPYRIISPDNRAAELQKNSNVQLDENQIQFDQNHLKSLSPIEWQCFLMNFIKYLKMSKAGFPVRMSHECDPITLQQFMTRLNTNDYPTEMDIREEIVKNEIQSDEKDYSKLSPDNTHFYEEKTKLTKPTFKDQPKVTIHNTFENSLKLANHVYEDHTEVTRHISEENPKVTKQSVLDQHELVKLAPHLSGEYFVNSEYIKNYTRTAQEAVNKFIKQNENMDEKSNDITLLIDPTNNNDDDQKVQSENSDVQNNIISHEDNNTIFNVQINSVNNLDDLSDNNIFQDMLDAYTDAPSTVPNQMNSLLYDYENPTDNADATTNSSASHNEFSPSNEIFYPKGFSLTKDQSDFVTEKPILLTTPKKIKIVIPYRKRSELKKEKDDDEFHKNINTWTADGYSNHKLSKINTTQSTTSFNAMQKSKSIPLLYLNSTQANNTGNEQSNISGNVSKTWEDLTVAISPYTKERVYVVTPKSN